MAAATAGDERAVDIVMRANDPLAMKMSCYFGHRYDMAEHMQDIEQASRIGLLNAVRTFDPSKSQFSTWATWKIRAEIQKEIVAGLFCASVPRSRFAKYSDRSMNEDEALLLDMARNPLSFESEYISDDGKLRNRLVSESITQEIDRRDERLFIEWMLGDDDD